MSFFDELKRRNVFRVGIAYAVTSWLLIQVADILFESIGTPPWVMQAMFVILLAGLVIILIDDMQRQREEAYELPGVSELAELRRSYGLNPNAPTFGSGAKP